MPAYVGSPQHVVWLQAQEQAIAAIDHPVTLFHATPTRNVANILRVGLNPVVHLADWDTREFISGFYVDWNQTCRTPITLLRVDASALELRPGWDGEYTWISYAVVDPSLIAVHA